MLGFENRRDAVSGGMAGDRPRALALAAVAIAVAAAVVLALVRLASGGGSGLVVARGDDGEGLAAADRVVSDASFAADDEMTAGEEGATGAAVSDTARADELEEGTLLVHIGGCVEAAGVYELPAGARIADAVAAAQGFTDDAAPDAVNLARPLSDGERVIVPSVREYEGLQEGGLWEPDGDADDAAPSQAGGKVNINTATAAQLESLPGVGPATAQKIVASRQSEGPFGCCEDLMRVSGIGQKKYDGLAELICVG